MTRESIIKFLPVFNAIANGKNVQIFDNLNLCYHARGWWKTVDNWGFGSASLSDYRIKNEDGSVEYFSEQPKYRVDRDLDEYQKYVPKGYLE